jgi:hypothetical protein
MTKTATAKRATMNVAGMAKKRLNNNNETRENNEGNVYQVRVRVTKLTNLIDSNLLLVLYL